MRHTVFLLCSILPGILPYPELTLFMSSLTIENLIRQSFDELYLQLSIKLSDVKLSDLLRKKNLYLLCATNSSAASKIIGKMLEEYISPSDESIFGDAFFKSILRIESESTLSSGEESNTIYKAIALIDLNRANPTQNRLEFMDAWAKTLNRLVHEFLNNFGNPDGTIDWENLLRYNSGKENVSWVSKVITVTVEDQEDESNDDEVGDVDYGNEDSA
ncbi:MAG: PmeII family type II restriction endonuclease [Ktedonobacteraceae bacterium]